MGVLRLTAFSGEQPRITPRLLPDTAAQEARDVRLDDGGLTPTRQAVQVTMATEGHQTIYRHGSIWLSWPGVVDAVPGPVAQDRLYFTGDGAPKVMAGGTTYPLAVPAPASALTAALSGTATGTEVVTRVYVFTWVTSLGEESEPSPASNEVPWLPGQTVTLSGFPAVPSGRGITHQRIYRTQTGTSGTYLYLIAERAAGTGNYVDTVPVDAFNEPLPSADWNAPPDGLTGLTSLPNGMMAAFEGRDLYFCEPWRPHAWPEKYVITTDYPIVGLASISTSIVVMTTGQPYLVSGTHPATMVAEKIEQNLPCINARGIADLGYVVAYPSHDGLVAVSGDGSTRLITSNLFSREKWLELSPQTAIAGQLSGRYCMFYDTVDEDANVTAGVIVIDAGGTPFLSRSSERATAVWYDLETSALYYLESGSNQIMQMDPVSGGPKTLTWRSKPFVLPAPQNFGAIMIDAESALTPEELNRLEAERQAVIDSNAAWIASSDPIGGAIASHAIAEVAIAGDLLPIVPQSAFDTVEVSVLADGSVVATVTDPNRVTRLPGGFLAREWSIAVSSGVTITQIRMGHTVADLQQA